MKSTRKKNYSKWYHEIIEKSELAEYSGVRGFMIIKPYGYALWEIIKNELDKILKNTGHENVYFPLLIPKSFLEKEKEHMEIFSEGCAVVTHSRIKKNEKEKHLVVDYQSKLREELVIRPTSESIVWNTYQRWIQSYRDLPILLNQWGNAVRWEMRNRLFLRNSEFLWQEGHTAHATKEEAFKETEKMLNVYTNFSKNFLAIPVIKGIKPHTEKFQGSKMTFCIEALMQDGKSLQMATSHFLGQNFSKAFNVKFTNYDGTKHYAWGTSWGTSTRLIGGLIMSHADDMGLIIPPKIAPIQVVIIPIYHKNIKDHLIDELSTTILHCLEKQKIRVKYDQRKQFTPGWKFHEYEMKGIPIRIHIGLKEIKSKIIEIVRRDTHEKRSIVIDKIHNIIIKLLEKIQNNLYEKSLVRTQQSIIQIDQYQKFKEQLNGPGGFILSHWDGTDETLKKIQKETEATIRCIPFSYGKKQGHCIYSGRVSQQRVVFSKSY
ncbi:proline--tRNA ligase [Blattabacterium cuenoti]|uniref:proline--tRNA ligase n=1 Tax=Blattabacterium cuenoti TaxID=1653831 RepID=UPI00163C7B2E|nr:proline--tRNA ligase [Blattabacterium cuenoti]